MNQSLIRLLPHLDEEDLEESLVAFALYTQPPVVAKRFRFDLSLLEYEYRFLNFRFYKSGLRILMKQLEIPSTTRCFTKVSGMEALCITLRRLSYPNRYVDLMELFGRSRSQLSHVFTYMIRFFMREWGHLLQGLNHPYVTHNQLELFSEAINGKGSPYKNCVGFLDGTVRSMCRATTQQKLFYNGHKRTHAIKFQSVVFPDGIIGSLYGPIDGRRHDAFMLHESKVLETMELTYYDQQRSPYYLYGDHAFPLQRHLIVPFKRYNLTPAKQKCNTKISKLRECVEWEFGKVIKNFAVLDFKKNLKCQLQPIDDYCKVGVILNNCHTCLYGSQTSDYFNLQPPGLPEYLAKF